MTIKYLLPDLKKQKQQQPVYHNKGTLDLKKKKEKKKEEKREWHFTCFNNNSFWYEFFIR